MKMEDLKKLVKIIELAQSRGAYNLEESATILQVIREAETKTKDKEEPKTKDKEEK